NDAKTSTDRQSGLFTPGTAVYGFWASSSMTIQQFFKRNTDVKAESALMISSLSGNIYFDPGYVNGHSVGFDAALLMHELLHSLGWEDSQLLSALGFPATSVSGRATSMLASDCFGVTK